MMRHFVSLNGPARSLGWFATKMPVYERILRRRGPIRTHLLASAISAFNGCAYCNHGHALAFQLHYFRYKAELFPLDETLMIELGGRAYGTIIGRLSEALVQAGLDHEVQALKRIAMLFGSPELAVSAEDKDIVFLIDMFASLNACGIVATPVIDQVHDPINRDANLITRYRRARLGI